MLITLVNLRNYTTKVPASRSVAEIEKILMQFGATHVMKEYRDEKVHSIMFKIEHQGYMLPANVKGVFQVVYSNNPSETEAKLKNAYNVAWRIIKDWIHSQLSLIASQQAEMNEVFLPYMWDGKTTLFKAYKEGTLQIEHRE